MKDSIVESVVAQMRSRSSVGLDKYGTTLDRNDLEVSQWIQHAKEEAMDLALYLEKLQRGMK